MDNSSISEEYLNSFVDNQLDSAERTRAFDTIRHNDKLKDRVCELRGLKEMMQHAYKQPPGYSRAHISQSNRMRARLQALAASLLLLIGGVSGWLTHAWTNTGEVTEINSYQLAAKHTEANPETRKIIVHISNANPIKLKAALDETEGLLDQYKRANRPIEIEVIANKRGIDLLRTNVSIYEKRILSMQEKYPNLSFLVCGQTLGKLITEGNDARLLPHTGTASSAADQINKRLLQGWGYVKI